MPKIPNKGFCGKNLNAILRAPCARFETDDKIRDGTVSYNTWEL